MRATPCFVKEAFKFNRRFDCLQGKEYFVDGELRFHAEEPDPDTPHHLLTHHATDGTYTTCGGPCFPNNGVIYANTDHTLSMSLRRLTCVNQPAINGLGYKLILNQGEFLRQHGHLYQVMRERYATVFDQWNGWLDYCLEHYADPHAKKELRMAGMLEIIIDGSITKDTWCRSIEYKTKTKEIAKNKKKSRGIGDMGLPASLQGFGYAKHMKTAQAANTIIYRGFTIQYIPRPSRKSLKNVFKLLLKPPGRGYGAIFSDDSCLSVRVNGEVRVFNLDIKSCDKSHGPELFEALRKITPNRAREALEKCLDQCQRPLKLRSVQKRGGAHLRARRSRKLVKLQTDSIFLPSGSVITTYINNFANMNIFFAIAEVNWNAIHDYQRAIVEAGIRVGYILSVEVCEQPEDITFLKHFPAIARNGEYEPFLALGVALRASGRTNGDYPGRGALPPRAAYFQKQLLRGMYPYTQTPFIDNMKHCVRQAIPGGIRQERQVNRIIEKKNKYRLNRVDGRVVSFTHHSICKRYGLRPHERISLLQMSRMCHPETAHACSATNKIYNKDYGLDALWF